jgi:CheY-like chemotaxis protein
VPPILLVEDDEDIRDLYGLVLRRDGYTVHEAENGEQALEHLETHDDAPCLVLLDLMMPVMSGPEFLRIIQDSDRIAMPPVIVLSAAGKLSDVPGAKRFMRKPVEPEVLLRVVREFCGPA